MAFGKRNRWRSSDPSSDRKTPVDGVGHPAFQGPNGIPYQRRHCQRVTELLYPGTGPREHRGSASCNKISFANAKNVVGGGQESEGGFILLEKWGLCPVLLGEGKNILLLLPGKPPQGDQAEREEGKERKLCLAVASRLLLPQSLQRQITTTDPDPSPDRQPVINTSLHLYSSTNHRTNWRLGKCRSILPARPPLADSKKNHNTRPRHTRRIWHPLPPVDPKHPEGKHSELPRCRVNRPPPYCGGRHTPRSPSQSCVPSAPNARKSGV